MEIKMILIKKANSTTTTTTETFKCYKSSTLFDAQNAGNRISELLVRFQIFLGGGGVGACPRGKGPCSPFSGHSRLLHLQWPLITKVTETPESGVILFSHKFYMYICSCTFSLHKAYH